MPQCKFGTFEFSFQPLPDLVNPYWCLPISQTRWRKAGKEQSWSASSPFLAPGERDLWVPQDYQDPCPAPWPSPSTQLPRVWWTELQHLSQPSLHPYLASFLKQDSMIRPDLLLTYPPLTFQPKCSSAPLCVTFPKHWDYGQELKVSFSSFFSSFPFVAGFIVYQHGSPGGACRDSRELMAEIEMSSIPFPFNHHSRLTQYQNLIYIFITVKSMRILPCLATICCICFFCSLAIGNLAVTSP